MNTEMIGCVLIVGGGWFIDEFDCCLVCLNWCWCSLLSFCCCCLHFTIYYDYEWAFVANKIIASNMFFFLFSILLSLENLWPNVSNLWTKQQYIHKTDIQNHELSVCRLHPVFNCKGGAFILQFALAVFFLGNLSGKVKWLEK